jgi:alginate O-acetyltransferase complex protein AlgI
MVFSSHLFVFYFLPLVLLLNYTLPFRWLSFALMCVNFLFYGWANPAWLGLLVFSASVDYVCGRALVFFSGLPEEGGDLPMLPRGGRRNGAQRTALAVSMVTNLGLLAFFKYFDFGVASVNALAGRFGLAPPIVTTLHVALPIGISFYTFQSMSYGIDVYRGEARALRNPIDFLCFVSLFPHLVAGPILRYATLAEQLRSRTFSWTLFARGTAFFSLGMGKKILLANPMAYVADRAFAADVLRWHDGWFGLVAYAFQIYFDFSAYSDMAVGLGLMLGFRLIKNFDDPYRAESVTDLWRRWHISLSTWLRDYLYVPLGVNRRGPSRTYVNLFVVMLLGGLWHGASWTFVVWGAIHGTLLALERARGRASLYAGLPRPLRIALTFGLTCLAWVFFRADTLDRAWRYLRGLAGSAPVSAAAELAGATLYTPYHVLTFVACGVLVWAAPQAWELTQRLTAPRAALCLAVLAASLLMMWTQTVNPFLYYQF